MFYGSTPAKSGEFAPPPAAPPPPPPPSDSDGASVRSVSLNEGDDTGSLSHSPNSHASSRKSDSSVLQYYHTSTYQNSRAAPIPMITNYGDIGPDDSVDGGRRKRASRVAGDPHMNPNTGQTNDEFGGIGSLREVTTRLRWMTIGSSLAALIWEGFAFPSRLVVHTWDQPASVVLGAYLGFFCLLLLGVELNAPMRDNFGVLYHPLGRAFLLTLLSTMSYGIHIAWWEILLCVAFAFCSIGYIYAYIKYPEYRRWQDYNDDRLFWGSLRRSVTRQSWGAAWANPINSRTPVDVFNGGKSWGDTQRETQSLLHQV